jgi:hypothetical protein
MTSISWEAFLQSIGKTYHLKPNQMAVLECISITSFQTKKELSNLIRRKESVTDACITARLSQIYNCFKINGSQKHKFSELRTHLVSLYREQSHHAQGFSGHGLARVHSSFPTKEFDNALAHIISCSQSGEENVGIMQTFAPNLLHFSSRLQECLSNNITVRILLAWPYSKVATLRDHVFKTYAKDPDYSSTDVKNEVIKNLETLETVKSNCKHPSHLQVRLYDTLPSLALYKAGRKAYASPFLHGSLAVDTFQLELDLNSTNRVLIDPILGDFENMWKISKDFTQFLGGNWHSDLKALFLNK